jgi:hypothetical protein|tara:strand:+ start:147 stop:398 length:252 start_codon:yes stop_codon:yes gene_type:complete
MINKPKIKIDITGEQGNAYYLIAFAMNFTKTLPDLFTPFSDQDRDVAHAIRTEMMAGDYEHLLDTFESYFSEWVELVGRNKDG